jgi:histidinol-phosphatase (PHP family)
MLVDYHTHTSFSADSDEPMERQVQAALAAGLHEIAFTEHEDYNPDDMTAFFFDPAAYVHELNRCRAKYGDRIALRQAIEISEPHRYPTRVSAVLQAHDWDFVLGSLHWLTPWINTFEPSFFTYRGEGNWRESFREYFIELAELAQHGDFDVLAHIDYPSRYGQAFFGAEYNIGEYETEIRKVLGILIARGKGTEINTSLLRRNRPHPNPPQVVINWYRQMGGEILTIGSDSHAAKDTGAHMHVAVQMAKQAGFSHIATYAQRKAKLVPIGEFEWL